MPLILTIWDQFTTFLESGGVVLTLIFVATALMWMLIAERIWFFWKIQPSQWKQTIDNWKARKDRSSWGADQIRTLEISRARVAANNSLPMIKALVATAPMLGLFGTVVGMIQLFDVMAISGNGNPRAMAAGIYQATITTMAGMVAALSGLYPSVRLSRRANEVVDTLSDHLTKDEAPQGAPHAS